MMRKIASILNRGTINLNVKIVTFTSIPTKYSKDHVGHINKEGSSLLRQCLVRSICLWRLNGPIPFLQDL